MKKIISILLCMALLVSVLAGCAGNNDTNNPSDGQESASGNVDNQSGGNTGDEGNTSPSFERTKIAFAAVGIDEDFVRMQEYFDNVLGPALNIEFMYSEALADAGAMTAFIENAYAAGCAGILTDSTGNIDIGAAVANDLGMYFVGISSAGAVENMELPYYASVTGASAEGYGESYAEALKSIVDDGEIHSLIILSGAACYGATSFIEATAGSLRALEEVYDLTYTLDINEIATSSVQMDAENDKGIKVTIVPGIGPTLTDTVSPLLQGGEYDVVVGTSDFYSALGVAVDEVEKATGKNISFVSRNAFTQTIGDAVNGLDSTGNRILDAVVANGMYERIAGVIVLRNCIDGFADNMRDNGKCSRIPGMRPLVVTTADEYNKLVSEDIPYCFATVDEFLQLTSVVNPDVTFADIDAFGSQLTTEYILDKFY